MKYALWVCLVVVCSNAYGQERRMPSVLRRISLAASCAASFWDYRTTAEGARYGLREGNGWLANRNGSPRLGLMLGVKAGMCGLSALAQESHILGRGRDRVTDFLWMSMNAGTAAHFTSAALHNRALIQELRRRQAQAATPSYLAPAAGQ